jgi:hypothetical protein
MATRACLETFFVRQLICWIYVGDAEPMNRRGQTKDTVGMGWLRCIGRGVYVTHCVGCCSLLSFLLFTLLFDRIGLVGFLLRACELLFWVVLCCLCGAGKL